MSPRSKTEYERGYENGLIRGYDVGIEAGKKMERERLMFNKDNREYSQKVMDRAEAYALSTVERHTKKRRVRQSPKQKLLNKMTKTKWI